MTNRGDGSPTNRTEGSEKESAFANLRIGFCQSRNWHMPNGKRQLTKQPKYSLFKQNINNGKSYQVFD
jgi:hypothetical protein